MAIFVINEWLWADSSGANGRRLQRGAYDAITKLAASEHQIVIIEGSAFDRKAWSICTSTDAIVQAIARVYIVGLRQNSDRCIILRPEDAATPPGELISATNPDDHYLLKAQCAVPNAILVTTDGALAVAVRQAGLPCLSREDFFHDYV